MSNFVDCKINHLTDEQLLAALLTKDDDGNWAFRTMFVDACENDAIDCSNASLPVGQALRNVIGVAECGKPAIRLASPNLAAIQDLQEFADDAAAAAASPAIPVGGLYYKTGLGLHVRMS